METKNTCLPAALLYCTLYCTLLCFALFCLGLVCYVQVARVVRTPTVTPSNTLLYLSATPRLKVEGTNFNFKETYLFFSPPLRVGDDVDVKVTN